MTLIGVHAGRIFLIYRDSHVSIVARLVVWGTFLCLVAALLCNFSQNDGVLPVNKNLWSPSFIFLMAGSGFLLLTLCYVRSAIRFESLFFLQRCRKNIIEQLAQNKTVTNRRISCMEWSAVLLRGNEFHFNLLCPRNSIGLFSFSLANQ